MSSIKADHSGHRERMRQRFAEIQSFKGFSEHEILEMLLYYCIPRLNTNELAHRLIDRFGSLNGVLDASAEELERSKLVNRNTAISLRFFFSLCGYYQKKNGPQSVSASAHKDVMEFITRSFAGETVEVVKLFPLDRQRRLKNCCTVSMGSTDSVSFYSSQLVLKIEELGCRSLFIAHNHPGQSGVPSDEDVVYTRLLMSKLKEKNITVLDHVIVGSDGTHSLRSSGLVFDIV
ncbi:MAG: hypothetical protein IKO27_00300 [Ruminococcus sp.]|nr:hypothetical protein [Ruminococcus sp.]